MPWIGLTVGVYDSQTDTWKQGAAVHVVNRTYSFWTLDGTTGSNGTVSFSVEQNYAYDITVSLSGYQTKTVTFWGSNVNSRIDVGLLPSCTPNWQCEPGQTGYETDGCGNRRANPACAYREAVLASCQWPTGTLIAGQPYQVTVTVNQGSMAENYKIVFSGDFVGESAPFTVNAGTGQQQFTAGNLIFTAGGAKNITASLVKV